MTCIGYKLLSDQSKHMSYRENAAKPAYEDNSILELPVVMGADLG